jgi:hypothetical protein
VALGRERDAERERDESRAQGPSLHVRANTWASAAGCQHAMWEGLAAG